MLRDEIDDPMLHALVRDPNRAIFGHAELARHDRPIDDRQIVWIVNLPHINVEATPATVETTALRRGKLRHARQVATNFTGRA